MFVIILKVPYPGKYPELTITTQQNDTVISIQILNKGTQTINETEIVLLHQVDEWLFLSQHYVLHHRLSGLKWLIDLYELRNTFTDSMWDDLQKKAKILGFEKIVWAVTQAFNIIWREKDVRFRSIKFNANVFLRLWVSESLKSNIILNQSFTKRHSAIFNKIEEAFWEILFISKLSNQVKAIARMCFPNSKMLKAIFPKVPSIVLQIIRPIHFIFCIISFLIFILDTLIRVIKKKF